VTTVQHVASWRLTDCDVPGYVSPLFLSRDDNMICIKYGYRVCEMIPWVCGCSKYSTNTLGSPHLCSIFIHTVPVPFLSVISGRIIFYICPEAEFSDEIQTKSLGSFLPCYSQSTLQRWNPWTSNLTKYSSLLLHAHCTVPFTSGF
jgi:hypothetical protein